MARTGKTPTTRLQKCAAAIEELNAVETLLKSFDLRTMPKGMRPGIKTARDSVATATLAIVAAMKADVPTEVGIPLKRSA